ncbi:MAG: 2,3-diphosphoglycerate-dependent phosphoglycerate mutase [Alphaproteobacteria bacterium]|nr:2,3-diphosphoglycerate-dependent phosphoglycerate mutase [Alphaproteobacteria bacterium]MCB9190599.1 2,3-diphosphoglycerate-dependent phosphoglycerate mutase [Flavobacteriales bacterium]
MAHATLVIVRHGQSEWNALNKFTGWVNVDLAPKGIAEAKEAGEKLKGYKFDKGFTSALLRAQRTLKLALEVTGQTDLAVVENEALNERMYGELQGMNKDEAREQFGEEQVHIWRRSFDTPPPGGESLKGTADRVLPYFKEVIEPELKAGKSIIIAAHGNSLRALIMYLEKLSPEEILKTEVPTGKPKLYEFDENLNVLHSEYI